MKVLFLVSLFVSLALCLLTPENVDGLIPFGTSSSTCVNDVFGTSTRCTANDVSIARLEVTDGRRFCARGEQFSFTAIYDLEVTATERYDVGIYFAKDQASALSGGCSRTYLPWTDADLAGRGGPITSDIMNKEESSGSDVCGDVGSNSLPQLYLTVTTICEGIPSDPNRAYLQYCTTWNQNSGNDCTGGDDLRPGTKSKCSCSQVPIFDICDVCDFTVDDINGCYPEKDGVGEFQGVNAPARVGCSPVELVSETAVDGKCGVYERTFRSTNECGEEFTQTQTVTIECDTCPFSVETVNQCYPGLEGLGADEGVVVDSPVEGCTYPTSPDAQPTLTACGSVSRSFTSVDRCGRTITQTQNVNINCPTCEFSVADIPDQNCEVPLTNLQGVDKTGLDASCSFSGPVLSPVDGLGSASCGTYDRIFRTVDLCEREITHTQNVVVDCPLCTLSGPSRVTRDCDESWDPEVNDVTTENCVSGFPEYSDSNLGDVCGVFSRTYTLNDKCGRPSGSFVQEVEVVDTVPPTIVCADQEKIVCPTNGGTDNCTPDEDVVLTPLSSNLVMNYLVTDRCGQSQEQSCTFTCEGF